MILRRMWWRPIVLAALLHAAHCVRVQGLREAPAGAQLGRVAGRRRGGGSALALLVSTWNGGGGGGVGGGGAQAKVWTGEQGMREMDRDGNGIVDREEYMLNIKDVLNEHGRDDKAYRAKVFSFVGDLYDMCDLDEDGFLNSAEVQFREFLLSTATRQARQGVKPDLAENFARARREHAARDTNRDSSVDRREFDPVWQEKFREWGVLEDVFTDPSVTKDFDWIFERADITRDGLLMPLEFLFAQYLVPDYALWQMTQVIFHDYDRDGNERIERVELETCVDEDRLAESPRLPMSQRVLEDFEIVDKNEDGTLDWREVTTLSAIALGSKEALV